MANRLPAWLALAVLTALTLVAAQEAPPVTIPEPVVPVYDKLKDLHLTTELVKAGQPAITIVAPAAYQARGQELQQAIQQITGVLAPVVDDTDPAAAVPLQGNLICLGNRSTNRAISALYDRAYTFLDAKYPGPGGHVVNSLHSPFGDGRNALFAGGSDTAGVAAATAALVAKLRAAGGGQGRLSVGWLQEIKLGAAYQIEHDVTKVEIWEASRMYGSSGYFGWNMLSKHMALYYQTGDESHLREFMRLAFPDAAAIKEIEAYDGERIENKHSPLSGPYHYSAHMMLILWDLIEESPFFTEEQRLTITNAFAAQLPHRVVEGVYSRTEPAPCVGDRHADWSATALYCLGRYFQKEYPGPVWAHCMAAADLYYSALETTYWMAHANDHLFWFTSYYDPMFDYMLLSGDQTGLANGNVRRTLRTQEILFQGVANDPGTNASSLSMLNKAAYLTGDGRWLWFREHCGLDTGVFRLGQSFWPGPELPPAPPSDLIGKWTTQPMPQAMWKSRGSVFPLEQSFKWGSYRSSLDGRGDYIMLDGFNGGGRNPYHTYDLLTLRIAGATLLDGYHNQVLTSADSMVEPRVAMDGALLYSDVVGEVAMAVGEVPQTPFANWRRTLSQRTERYALIVDDLAFRAQSDNMKVETEWQPRGGIWDETRRVIRWRVSPGEATPAGWLSFPALDAPCRCGPGTPEELLSSLQDLDIVLLKAPGAKTYLEMPFALAEAVSGEVFTDLLSYLDRGIVQLSLDGRPLGEEVDLYAPGVATTRVSLGNQDLAAGEHVLRVEVTGKRALSARHYVGLIGVKIRPPGAPAALPLVEFELHSGDPLEVTQNGGNMVWRGPVSPDQRRCFFHLIAQNDSGRDDALECVALAENAAGLRLPEPALAVAGTYGSLDGDLVVLSERHLSGHGLRRVGAEPALLAADQPVAADWDFERGTLEVVAGAATRLSLDLADRDRLQLDDARAVGDTLGGAGIVVSLSPGRHTLTGASPSTPALKPLVGVLPGMLADARQRYAANRRDLGQTTPLTAPERTPAFTAEVGGKPGPGTVVDSAQGPLVALPVGKTVKLISTAGEAVRTLEADAEVRVIHWWPGPKLLLAGCVDEQVIAFNEAGERQWVFTSEMDQEVWEAGKQYWFKPAHPGIYGLSSGDLGGGRDLCFVGSACTMEFLDEAGQLVKRSPVFWGPGTQFLIIDDPDGGKQLLQARWRNDGLYMAILSGETLQQVGRGFDGVPAGHTYVTGWDCMNREDNFYADLDGDGEKEVVSAINGTWNRVTVWDRTGTPLANAQFGPGVTAPRANLRQMDIGDLRGDRALEIAVATSQGMVVVLDARCQKVWAKRLSSPPTVLRVVKSAAGKAGLCVGCEDGTVLWLDGEGEVTRRAKVSGALADLRIVPEADGETVVVATATGQVAGFAADDR